jgi:hypothetical protein
MPSHISHALLIEDVISHPEIAGALDATDPRCRGIMIAGAQGPDFFLHNHRRKPRGFRYGALLHRKGNAALLASLAAVAHSGEYANDLTGYALAYTSHVWFDRFAHPYINWSAGWRGNPDAHPDRPAMHAFLERLIDVQLLRVLRDESVEEYNFAARLPRRGGDFFRMRPYLIEALRDALVSAAGDDQLPRRLLNALHDSLGFYRFTESPDERYFSVARYRERKHEISPRWLSLVHPPEELIRLDTLNFSRRRWSHPCALDIISDETVPQIYERARARTIESARIWLRAAEHPSQERLAAVREDIGETNLNDGIVADPPCHRTFCDPLPLIELYHEIKRHYER